MVIFRRMLSIFTSTFRESLSSVMRRTEVPLAVMDFQGNYIAADCGGHRSRSEVFSAQGFADCDHLWLRQSRPGSGDCNLRIYRLDTLFVYDRPQSRPRICASTYRRPGIPITSVSDLPAASPESDICVTCTTSTATIPRTGGRFAGNLRGRSWSRQSEKQELHPALMAKKPKSGRHFEQCAVMEICIMPSLRGRHARPMCMPS